MLILKIIMLSKSCQAQKNIDSMVPLISNPSIGKTIQYCRKQNHGYLGPVILGRFTAKGSSELFEIDDYVLYLPLVRLHRCIHLLKPREKLFTQNKCFFFFCKTYLNKVRFKIELF